MRKERVVDIDVDVDALHRNAQLPGVGEAGTHRCLGSLGRVYVGTHDHGVLAAEFEGALDEPLGAPFGHDPTGRRGAGEHHVVDSVDDEGAGHGAFTRHDGHEPVGQTCKEHLLQHPRGDEGRLRIGLQQHAVAREQRGNRVTCRKRERVVPGRDDAHEPDRLAQFLDTDEHGQCAAHPPTAQQLRGSARVVLGHDSDIEHFLESVGARLTHFPLQQVECLIALGDDQIMETPHDPHSIAHRPLGPFTLHGARPPRRTLHVVLRGERQAVEQVAREGRVHVAGVGIGCDGEARDQGSGRGRRRDYGHVARLRAHEGVPVGVRRNLRGHATLIPAEMGRDERGHGGSGSEAVIRGFGCEP